MLVGDGETQPTEGVDALEDLANSIDTAVEVDEDQRDAQETDGEESEDEQEVEEGDEEEEEQQEEPTFTVKVNGKDVTLTQTEALEMASKGADYTQKTMALADERKAVEAERTQASEYRQRHEHALTQTEDRLQAFAQFMEEQVGNPPPIEWAQQDAAYYLAQKQLYEDRKGQLEKARNAIDAVRQEAQRTRQARIAETAATTEKALRDTLPGWNDAVMNDLGEYLQKQGITPDTALDAFVLEGVWKLAHKAKAYDQIQADKAKLKPKNELKKVQKPSAAAPTGKTADREKREAAFNKNPSVDALAEFFR